MTWPSSHALAYLICLWAQTHSRQDTTLYMLDAPGFVRASRPHVRALSAHRVRGYGGGPYSATLHMPPSTQISCPSRSSCVSEVISGFASCAAGARGCHVIHVRA
eukprot:1041404-Rhodomonas_salina.2